MKKQKIYVIKAESGRSMVEIVGVLAIMGILTIGGIIGYQWIITKYNINEILNEVQKRAYMASQQKNFGQSINLKEFYINDNQDIIDNKYPIHVSDQYYGNPDFFYISVSHLSKEICNGIIQTYWTLPVDILINNNNIQSGIQCLNNRENEITFAFHNTLKKIQPPDSECKNIICDKGTTCQKGRCLCPTGWEKCDDICCSTEQICTASGTAAGAQCYISEGECTRNEDCINQGPTHTEQYCSFPSPIDSKNPGKGVCIDKGVELNNNNAIQLDIDKDGKPDKYLWKGPEMFWWSAKNYCLSHNKKLTTLNSKILECYQTNGLKADENYAWFCCAPNGGDCSFTQITQRSDIMYDLIKKIGSSHYWIDKDTNIDKVYFINGGEGLIQNHFPKNREKVYALCEQDINYK